MQTLNISGEMTIYTAAEQKNQLLAFLDCSHELEINLAQVTELDTAGTQLLLLAKQEAIKARKNLKFVMPSTAVLDVLSLGNLVALFEGLLTPSDDNEDFA
jgi:anti-anti-sigma factor